MDIKYTNFKDALLAVTKNGLDIKYCSEELIANIDILKAAIIQNYYALKEIKYVRIPNSNSLVIDNKDLMIELVKIDPKVFRDISSNLKDDEDIVVECVQKNGAMLKEASKRLQNNKKIILLALSNTIYALDGVRVDEEIKNDKDIALNILNYRHNRINIKWFGNDLKQEIINALGYDITLEPLNQKVIDQVKLYLKCKIENKPFIKPECPFEKEEKKEESIVKQKNEVKQEIKEEKSKIEEVKQETKVEQNTINYEQKSNIVEQELIKLNLLKEAIQRNIIKTNELQEQINEIKRENERLKIDLNNYTNNIKNLVLKP